MHALQTDPHHAATHTAAAVVETAGFAEVEQARRERLMATAAVSVGIAAVVSFTLAAVTLAVLS